MCSDASKFRLLLQSLDFYDLRRMIWRIGIAGSNWIETPRLPVGLPRCGRFVFCVLLNAHTLERLFR